MTVKEILELIEPSLAASAVKELEEIKAFASIDCGSGDIEGNARVVAQVDSMLSEIEGIEIRHIQTPTHGIMVAASVNKGNPNGKIVLNAHMDTVFKRGDVAEHPFRVEGDVGYGLGAVDCKGGIVVAINAVRILSEKGLLPDKEILFLFNSDEEIGSSECREHLEAEAAGATAALVYEPSREDNGVLTSRKGAFSFTIKCHGINAHSGNAYKAGASAVIELAQKIVYLYEHNDDENGIQFNLTGIADGGKPANIIPDYACCRGSVRYQTRKELDYIKSLLDDLKEVYIPGTATEVEILREGHAMERTEANVRLYEFIKGIGAQIGYDLPEQSAGGSGDGAIFTGMGIPCADALGPYMYKIHSFDESFRVSSVEEKTRLSCCILAMM